MGGFSSSSTKSKGSSVEEVEGAPAVWNGRENQSISQSVAQRLEEG
jgi:hypothetical protein